MTDLPMVDDITVEEEVRLLRANTISSASRKVYLSATTQFLLWLLYNNPTLLHANFVNRVQDDPTAETVHKYLQSAPENPPILFEDFEVNHFMQFIVSLRKPDGNKLSYSSYNTHRAALFNVFRDYKISMSESLQSELKNHFRGLKRTTTKTVAEGGGRIKTGKDALDFGLYKFLCLEFLKSSRPDFIFAHCFMIFCWNLMCRAGNMASVCWSHLEWRNDALGIYFAHMKNDQFGERPRDPRHVYANPLIPEICPVLSLGVYLMTIPIDPKVSQLFPWRQSVRPVQTNHDQTPGHTGRKERADC